jgi:hypothetical protein
MDSVTVNLGDRESDWEGSDAFVISSYNFFVEPFRLGSGPR